MNKISPCPAKSTGVHSWIMSAANRCRHAGMSAPEAAAFIAARITRPPKPANEIATAVAKAFNSKTEFQARPGGGRNPAPKPLAGIQFDPAKLRAAAARVAPPRNWRHWLWERSPKRPETQNAFSFLAQLYAPGERIHVFDKLDSKTPLATVAITGPMDCRVPALIRSGGNFGAGIWYLCNPVDNQWHPNPRNRTSHPAAARNPSRLFVMPSWNPIRPRRMIGSRSSRNCQSALRPFTAAARVPFIA